MDLITDAGSLALGSRFRRMSEYIMKQGEDIYQLYQVDFQPQNFPVFYAISKEGRMGIMELADRLQLTHPAIIQQAKALEKQGLIISVKDQEDKRRRWLSLSDAGQKLLPELELIWQDLRASLDEAIGHKPASLLDNLTALEYAFNTTSFIKRVSQKRIDRITSRVEILEYQDIYAAEFARINYAWIEKYFNVEDVDRAYLDHPKSKIIDSGGAILFAKLDQHIIGTVALVQRESGVFELSKMGVDEEYQGFQIGKQLGKAIIQKARSMGARRIFLESNRRLTPALNLYRKLGFREVTRTGHSDYSRSDIVMEMYV